MSFSFIKQLTSLTLGLVLFQNVHSQTTRTANTGTNTWNTNAAWVGSVQPATTDDVLVNNSATVLEITKNTTTTIRDVTVSAGTLRKESGGTATLSCRNLTITGGSVGTANNGLTLTLTGTLTMSGGTLDVSNVTAINGNVSIISGGTITGSTTINGNVTIAGNMTLNSGTIINGNLTVSSGTLSGSATINGNVSVASGATLGGSGSFTVSGGNLSLATGSATSGTVAISGGGSVTNCSGATVTITNGVAMDCNGNITSTGGTLTTLTISNNMNLSSNVTMSTGTLTVAEGVVLNTNGRQFTGVATANINGTLRISNPGGLSATSSATVALTNGTATTLNMGTNARIIFDTTVAQTIQANTYETLILSGGTKTMAGAIIVNDTLRVSSGATMNMSTNALTATSAIIDGTGTIQTQNTTATPIPSGKTWTQTIEYNSASAQTIVAGTYASLNGTGGNRTLPNGGTITVSGTFTPGAGTYTTTGNTFVFNGTGAHNVPALNYNHLTIEGNSTKTMTGTSTVAGNMTLTLGTLSLNGNGLSVAGTLSRTSGVINGTSGTLTLNGSSAQSIPASLFTDTLLQHLTINNSAGVTLNGTVKLTGTLTPTAGTLTTGGNLRLISTATGTARIAAGTGSYISGNVTAERYIPSVARRWRFLSSPVTSSTLADWKNEIHITGTGGTGNGFDAASLNPQSVFTYNESTIGTINDGWSNATNITNALTVGKGYRVFVRGTRNDPTRLTNTGVAQDEVTLNVVGTVNTGNITMPVTFTSSGTLANDGWNLLGNPYPSDYDWNAFYDNGGTTKTNIDPTIYIYNATSNSYDSYNASTNSGTGSLSTGIIPSGAAFWVKANASSPSLILTEAFKTSTQASNLFKTMQDGMFRITIYSDSINYDELAIKYFDKASAGYDSYDIKKMGATTSVSAYDQDNIQLGLSVRPLRSDNDTIRLNVMAPNGNVRFEFKNSDIIGVQDQVFLFDHYKQLIVDLKTQPSYTFEVDNTIPTTTGMNRFIIVVASNNQLPLDLISFSATLNNNQHVNINWTTAAEVNVSHFEVERSTDGLHFEHIGTISAKGVSSHFLHYAFEDPKPAQSNYYRLKMIDLDGQFVYSEVRFVELNSLLPVHSINVYPVPAVKQVTFEKLNQIPIRSVTLYDIHGKQVHAQSGKSQVMEVSVENLNPGIYVAEVTDTKGNVYKHKVVKE